MNKQYFAVSQRRSLDHGMFFIIDHQFRWSCVVSFVILLPYRPQLLEYTPQSNRDLYRILCCVMSQQQQQQPPPEAKSLAKFSDGISALEYYLSEESTSSHIAATSWDGTLRIHDTATQTALATQSMECGPLLSLAIPSPTSLVVGSLDGSIKSFDPTTSTVTLVGRHSKADASPSSPQANAVSCLVALNDSTVVSASWNGQLMVWDLNNTTTDPLAVLDLPGKAFGMDVHTEGQVLVATAGRRICVVDCATPSSPKLVENRESSLKFQTRCIASFGARNGFAIGSVEGRVGVEFLSTSSGKKFAFKCHRVNDTVHPVNCIQFHPKFPDTFATGGCDGTVVLWDGGNKKKLTTIPTFPTSISALAFNHDGSELAIAASYTFEDGDREHPQDELFVRKILDFECLPKPKE